VSGPVDVLAVLDSLLLGYDNDSVSRARIQARNELRAARAAVAELIEAAKNHLEAYGERYDASVRIAASMDLRAALARVGGAA
jgi:hypothetical protein